MRKSKDCSIWEFGNPFCYATDPKIADSCSYLRFVTTRLGFKNEKEAKLTLRINTAYCPIDLVFNGNSFNKLELEWISKNYNENSFFTNFGSKDIL